VGEFNETESLVPSEASVERSEVVTATLGRFLPASIITAFVSLAVVSGFPLESEWIFMPMMAGILMIGFGIGLEVLRSFGFLHRDVNVRGRRSVIAGILSPFAYAGLAFLVTRFSDLRGTFLPAIGMSALFLIGVVLAFVMFFPFKIRPANRKHLRRPFGILEGGSTPTKGD